MRGFKNFRLDRRNGKLLGVCAGIANQTGWDVTFVRVGMVLAMLVGPFPLTLIPYALVGLLARQQSAVEANADAYIRPLPKANEEVVAEMRDIDRRMAEVERHVVSANGSLAREIEELR